MALKLPVDQITWRLELLQHNINHDTVLEVKTNGFKVTCHWWILSERSEVFRAMFRSNWKENKQLGMKNVQLGVDIDEDTLKNIVRFLYVGEITISVSTVFTILQFLLRYYGAKNARLETVNHSDMCIIIY